MNRRSTRDRFITAVTPKGAAMLAGLGINQRPAEWSVAAAGDPTADNTWRVVTEHLTRPQGVAVSNLNACYLALDETEQAQFVSMSPKDITRQLRRMARRAARRRCLNRIFRRRP